MQCDTTQRAWIAAIRDQRQLSQFGVGKQGSRALLFGFGAYWMSRTGSPVSWAVHVVVSCTAAGKAKFTFSQQPRGSV
jgi:hypothetical protein